MLSPHQPAEDLRPRVLQAATLDRQRTSSSPADQQGLHLRISPRNSPKQESSQETEESGGLPTEEHRKGQDDGESRWKWKRQRAIAIIAFILPALSIVLCDPMMSLLDTIFIGQFSTTDDLAALGPNTLVFNSAQWIFNSLAVGTTSVIVAAVKEADMKKASEALSVAVWLGILFGIVELVLFEGFATSIIKATGVPEQVVALSAKYMYIRAIAAPAVLVTLVLQASLLAQKDAITPCRIVLVAGLIKCLLDVALLIFAEFGAVEAAGATAISQYFSCALLLYWNCTDPTKVQWHWQVTPTAEKLMPFVECLGPLTCVYMLKNMCYILVNTAATSQAFLAVAAHQALYSLWVMLAFCATPLERAAISFLPTTKAGEVHDLEGLLIGMGTSIGLGLGLTMGGVAILIPSALTQDERVWDYMHGIAPQACVSLVLHSLEAGYNGILLAKQDYTFLLMAMFGTLVVLQVYNSYIQQQELGLPAVWWGMVMFVGIRCATGRLRHLWLRRRERQEGAASSRLQ